MVIKTNILLEAEIPHKIILIKGLCIHISSDGSFLYADEADLKKSVKLTFCRFYTLKPGEIGAYKFCNNFYVKNCY